MSVHMKISIFRDLDNEVIKSCVTMANVAAIDDKSQIEYTSMQIFKSEAFTFQRILVGGLVDSFRAVKCQKIPGQARLNTIHTTLFSSQTHIHTSSKSKLFHLIKNFHFCEIFTIKYPQAITHSLNATAILYTQQ